MKHTTELYIIFFPFFWVHFLQNKSSSLFFSRKKTVHGLQRANKRWTQTRDGLQRAKVNCKRLLYSWMNATIYTADRWNGASVILNQQVKRPLMREDLNVIQTSVPGGWWHIYYIRWFINVQLYAVVSREAPLSRGLQPTPTERS